MTQPAEKRAELTTDVEKLRLLADWHDVQDDARDYTSDREVQADLRRIATELEAAPDTAAERDRLKAEMFKLMDAARAAGVRLAHHMMAEEEISGEPHALDVVVINQINAAVKSAKAAIDPSMAKQEPTP